MDEIRKALFGLNSETRKAVSLLTEMRRTQTWEKRCLKNMEKKVSEKV